MSKAKLGVLLAGAYTLGLVLAGVAVLVALPQGSTGAFRSAAARVPTAVGSAAEVARVAVHAGSLGLKHLPEAIEAEGFDLGHRELLRPCRMARTATQAANALRINVQLAGLPGQVLVLDEEAE
jgi:hypothetical protein